MHFKSYNKNLIYIFWLIENNFLGKFLFSLIRYNNQFIFFEFEIPSYFSNIF